MKYWILVLLLVLLSGCKIEVETPIIVEDGDILPEDICNKLNTVVIVHKTGCPGCSIVVPRVEKIEEELGKKFLYLNTMDNEERTKLMALGFIPKLVPTVVVDCKVYSRILTEEELRELL